MHNQLFDVAVIGSGFGGATAAYALSNAGLKTILIERGSWAARDQRDWDAKEILVDKRYKSNSPLLVKQYQRQPEFDYPNEVVGGMSIFYGGAAIRLRQTDFTEWPIVYSDLEEYYKKAESLYEVHGIPNCDPFEPPRSSDFEFATPELTKPAHRIYLAAKKLGYRPFPLPLAINYHNQSRPICSNCFTCDGFPCKTEAKNDTTTTALKKSSPSHLKIYTGLIANKLLSKDNIITGLECIKQETKEKFNISAKLFVISAGAIQSPALLLRSDIQKYDQSNSLGRYLMRHCNGIVGAVFPYKINPENTNHKQVGITHFYEDMREISGKAVGIIQDMCMPPREAVKHFAPKGLGQISSLLSSYIQSLICIAEDTPQFENKVSLNTKIDTFGIPLININHSYSKDDYQRRNYLMKQAKIILRNAGSLVRQAKEIDSFSHAVGTVRFGNSPNTSVLDKTCRANGIKNLFVLDGSFMPTSGGVNPSLTIAANSLRVSDYIIDHYGELS